MLLLTGTSVVHYVVALTIAGRTPWSPVPITPLLQLGQPTGLQRLAISVLVISNLGVLAFFKYFNFAIDTFNHLLKPLGIHHAASDPLLRIALPLKISFYTFQSLSYTIDVYRGRTTANQNLIDLACFLAMFPQLVAGPIVRYADIAEQLSGRRHTIEKFSRGIVFLAFGLAKKVLLANPAGSVADTLFATPGIGMLDAWYGAVAFAFQIYFDFSGYSDMAVGLGLMLGFELMMHFDSTYRATSITDFWRRWHRSLSTWLRDYLYIPLGRNRRGAARTYLNITIVMLLGGLWHGAAWTFVAWGAIHGAALIFERMRHTRTPVFSRLPAVSALITFLIVTIAWVFFRTATLHDGLSYCAAMSGFGHTTSAALLIRGVVYQPYYLLMLAACAAVTWLSPKTWNFTQTLPTWKIAYALVLLVISMIVLEMQAYNPFIYFIF